MGTLTCGLEGSQLSLSHRAPTQPSEAHERRAPCPAPGLCGKVGVPSLTHQLCGSPVLSAPLPGIPTAGTGRLVPQPGVGSQLLCALAVHPWVHCFTSLCHGFLLYKVE